MNILGAIALRWLRSGVVFETRPASLNAGDFGRLGHGSNAPELVHLLPIEVAGLLRRSTHNLV